MIITKEQLLRKINGTCHVCGRSARTHHMGTKTHFYSCERHRRIVDDFNLSEEDTLEKVKVLGGKHND